MNAPAREETEVTAGQSYVLEKNAPVIIIGGGPSGIRAAQDLSRNGKDSIIFNAERWQPYNRVKLTPLLSGDVQLGQVSQDLNFSGKGKVSLYSGNSIIDIDQKSKTVQTSSGRIWPYEKLIVCTGSRAHIPPIPGSSLDGVFTFRNFDDVEKLIARSFSSRRCVVIGGGLLGLEAARGMVERGVETWVIEHETSLMARQLDQGAADLLKSQVEKMGIKVLTGTSVSAFAGSTRLEAVEIKGGEPIECDTIILCTGIRPNMELAREIGLSVGRGITVNGNMQTSNPDIFAVGECAEFNENIYGLVGPCFEQASVAVQTICGNPITYEGSVPATKLKIIGTDVFSMGDVEQLEQRRDIKTYIYEDSEKKIYRRLVLLRGKLIGAIAIGDWPEFNRVQEAIKTKSGIFPWQLKRFRGIGNIWPEAKVQSVRDWPRSATVCNCTGVTRGQIGDSISLGAMTLEDIKRETGASTVCGSCKINIGELLDTPVIREPVRKYRWIAYLSAFAGLIAVLTLFLPIWETATDIEKIGIPEFLFLDSFSKQVSGYSLLALSVLAAILSLRKRIKWLQYGAFWGWRIFHLAIGLTSLVILFAHTGFRLGENLNMWLMVTFLGLGAAGALAGLTTAFEHKIFNTPKEAAKTRSLSFWFHLIAFWPLPVLLSVHILTVYYF